MEPDAALDELFKVDGIAVIFVEPGEYFWYALVRVIDAKIREKLFDFVSIQIAREIRVVSDEIRFRSSLVKRLAHCESDRSKQYEKNRK